MKTSLRRIPLSREISFAVIAYLYLPVIVLAAYSFNANRTATVWTEFSFDWYMRILHNPSIQAAALNSLIVATAATVASTIIGLLFAVGTQKRFKGLSTLEGLINSPLILPEIVIAVATLILFVSVGLGVGLLSITIAHIAFCIPFAYLPIKARLAEMDKHYNEAALDLYANRFDAFRLVTLPLLWPGILSGATLAFVISLDDFITSFFLSGPGATTLPVYIFSSIKAGITPEVNAISTVMVLVSVLLVVVSFAINRIGKPIRR
jgi:spermidine/putrescine transport system permease protein